MTQVISTVSPTDLALAAIARRLDDKTILSQQLNDAVNAVGNPRSGESAYVRLLEPVAIRLVSEPLPEIVTFKESRLEPYFWYEGDRLIACGWLCVSHQVLTLAVDRHFSFWTPS